jgi:hypothetical protein
MSTLAIGLYVAAGVALIVAIVLVVAAARSTMRKGGLLLSEIDALQNALDDALQSRR